MSNPTFGGTRPLRRVEVVTRNIGPSFSRLTVKKHTLNNAEIQDNGVPVSGHIYVSDACIQAREKAKEHGLDCFYLNGKRFNVDTMITMTYEKKRKYWHPISNEKKFIPLVASQVKNLVNGASTGKLI